MKHYFVLSDYGDFGLCGPNIKIEQTVADKKEVTCKKCIKKLSHK